LPLHLLLLVLVVILSEAQNPRIFAVACLLGFHPSGNPALLLTAMQTQAPFLALLTAPQQSPSKQSPSSTSD
jgi:hypothetical protein